MFFPIYYFSAVPRLAKIEHYYIQVQRQGGGQTADVVLTSLLGTDGISLPSVIQPATGHAAATTATVATLCPTVDAQTALTTEVSVKKNKFLSLVMVVIMRVV